MSKLNKKEIAEMDFYIKSGKRKRICYNETCKKCVNDCKQSYRTELVACPQFKTKRSKNEKN